MHVQIKRIDTHVCMVETVISPGLTVNAYLASDGKLEIWLAKTNTTCGDIMFPMSDIHVPPPRALMTANHAYI